MSRTILVRFLKIKTNFFFIVRKQKCEKTAASGHISLNPVKMKVTLIKQAGKKCVIGRPFAKDSQSQNLSQNFRIT